MPTKPQQKHTKKKNAIRVTPDSATQLQHPLAVQTQGRTALATYVPHTSTSHTPQRQKRDNPVTTDVKNKTSVAISTSKKKLGFSEFSELGDDVHANSLVQAAKAAQTLAVGTPIKADDGL